MRGAKNEQQANFPVQFLRSENNTKQALIHHPICINLMQLRRSKRNRNSSFFLGSFYNTPLLFGGFHTLQFLCFDWLLLKMGPTIERIHCRQTNGPLFIELKEGFKFFIYYFSNEQRKKVCIFGFNLGSSCSSSIAPFQSLVCSSGGRNLENCK
ncbi:hypothetical protein PanWU01x14_329270 [Parasponia andersonii]|uniref:Uncharacterized protein n=1 Tax=Parasponia andersonii TaxID=3476 RepID=A0A2P5AIG4_PARAD|nr:hypothetical protein PanWU01x14_329270 [Parasponia andersonii]